MSKLVSIAKGAGVAAAGAGLAYLYQYLTSTDLGGYGPLAAAALSVVANALRKYAVPAVGAAPRGAEDSAD